MDLEAFRAAGHKPRMMSIDERVERIRRIFDASQKYMAELGKMHVYMLLQPSEEAQAIFIKWMLQTGWCAFVWDKTWKLVPYEEGHEGWCMHVDFNFAPAGATAHEVEYSRGE